MLTYSTFLGVSMSRLSVMATLFLLAFLFPVVARAQFVSPPPHVSPRDFAVMAWGDSPSDPEQLRLMKEVGLNISGFCRAEDADRVRAAGLACFVSDPRASGYDWEKMPTEDQIRPNITALAREVGDHPAVLGFFLRDEPTASLMPGLGRVATLLQVVMPNTWPYVNLHPTYTSRTQLGTPDYEAYVRRLIETVHPPFISYDNYSLVEGEMRDYFFTNLEIVRRVSLDTRTPFWNCILANAHYNLMEPSDATFNLQVYGTLAYGGRGIQYYSYFTPAADNFRLGAIDQFGNRTPTWDMLRRINYQIHRLAPTLIKLRSTGVYHSPDVPAEGRPLAESRLVKQVETFTPSIHPPIPARFLIGEFVDQQEHPYLMIVNKDLKHSFLFRLHLKEESRRLLRISSYSGREELVLGEITWLAPGGGVLLRID